MTDYNAYTDHDICDLLRSGDEAAFKFLYDKFWSKLYYLAAKKLNSAEEAEEVVQDIFFRLWQKRDNFQLKVGFENYFVTAVKFEVFKHRAKRLKLVTVSIDVPEVSIQRETYDWDLYDLNRLKFRVHETINSFPPKCRLVFTMSRESDLTNKQIAAALNITEKAVEKHITSALKALKVRFGQYFTLVLLLKGWF